MVDTQEELKTGIGTEEVAPLKPAIVKISIVTIEEVGEKKAKKVICKVAHPDSAELVSISSVKYENKTKLETSGLWFNKDKDGLIKKNSALAFFLRHLKCKTIEELVDKSLETIIDDKGYLMFKGY